MSGNMTVPDVGPTVPGTIFRVLFWCSLGVVEALSLLGNAIIIYIIMTRRNLHSNTNWFLFSLAVSDIGVPLFIIPSYLLCTETNMHCEMRITTVIYNYILFSSVLNLCSCTSERYIAILHPFKYINIINQKRVMILLFHIWALPIPLSLLPVVLIPNKRPPVMAQRYYWLIQVILFMIIPSVVMLAAFWRIHRVAIFHANQIRRQSLMPDEEEGSRRRQKLVLEARSTLKVYGVVVVLFTFSWLLSAYRMIRQKYLLQDVPVELDYISRFLLVSNAAINPYIYGMQKADIKKEFLAVLRKRTSSPTNASSASNANNSANDYVRNGTDI